MAKQLEEHLYRSARTKAEYLDQSTLKRRLRNIAQSLDLTGAASAGEQPQVSALDALAGQRAGVEAGQSEAERRTLYLQQQLAQLQQSPQPGGSVDFQEQQAKLMSTQQAGVYGLAGPAGMSSATAASQNAVPSSPHVSYKEPYGEVQSHVPPSLQSSTSAAGPGILKTGTAKYQDPGAAQKKKVIRQQQQRLLLLRHASKCRTGATCKTKFCGQMVELWKHMKKCRDKSCKTAHCLSSRCVLNHYRVCKSENKTSTCEVCAPVMRHIKHQNSQKEEDPLSLKEVNKSETPSACLPESSALSQIEDTSSTDAIALKKRQQLEELRAAQQKLQQQQMLLKQLKQQQADLVEQQKQLSQQQEHVLPQTQQGQQLKQQQGLLEQLQQLFQQQQELLQQELLRQSQALQGDGAADSSTQLGEDEGIGESESATGRRRACQSRGRGKKVETQSSPSSSRGKAGRGRGHNSKHLGSVEINPLEAGDGDSTRNGSSANSAQGRMSSLEETSKRSADQMSLASQTLDDADARPSKAMKLEPPSADSAENLKTGQPKVLEPGNTEGTTSLIESMPVDAIEGHLESLNDSLHLTPRTVSRKCLPLIRKLIQDQFGWVFHDAVDPVALGLLDYFDVVKNPMHLALVETNLANALYVDTDSFARDTRLVFENAILYNGVDSEVGGMAAVMLRQFEKDYKGLLKGELTCD